MSCAICLYSALSLKYSCTSSCWWFRNSIATFAFPFFMDCMRASLAIFSCSASAFRISSFTNVAFSMILSPSVVLSMNFSPLSMKYSPLVSPRHIALTATFRFTPSLICWTSILTSFSGIGSKDVFTHFFVSLSVESRLCFFTDSLAAFFTFCSNLFLTLLSHLPFWYNSPSLSFG